MAVSFVQGIRLLLTDMDITHMKASAFALDDFGRMRDTLDRPGNLGGSNPWRGWSHARSQEISQ